MRQPLKVPAVFLLAGLAVAACGGDAESAADADSEPMQEEVTEAEVREPGVEPDPAPAEPAPTTRDPAAAPPPSSEPASSPAPAEDPAPAEEEVEEEPVAVPAGARVHTLVDETISTRTHETDDPFQVRVTEDVLDAEGMILVPEGALLEGRVMEARGSTSSDEEAVLVLGFESLVIDGRSYPFHGTVVETELEAGAGDSGARSAAKVATGAAAGAILGQILGGDTRSTVAGAAVGAAAGAGVALTTREGHAVLPEGSRMIVQVDQPVILAEAR